MRRQQLAGGPPPVAASSARGIAAAVAASRTSGTLSLGARGLTEVRASWAEGVAGPLGKGREQLAPAARPTPRAPASPAPQVPPEAIDLDFVPQGHSTSWWEVVDLTKLDVSRRARASVRPLLARRRR